MKESKKIRKAIATVIAVLVVGTTTFGVSAQAVYSVPTSISTGASVNSKAALSGLTTIDTPTANYTGSFVVRGWALNSSGIGRADIYVYDSKGKPHWLGSVPGSKFTARPDVQRAYPAYKTLNSGYSYTVPTGKLSQGVYTLAVAGIGKNGSVKWASKQIRVGVTTTTSPQTTIDTASTTYTGPITVRGWALNGYGIGRVDIYAYDSKGKAHFLGSEAGSKLTARPDVKRAYPAFQTLNSGYSYTVSAGTLAAGNYTLAVAGIGKNGAVKWATKSITVKRQANYPGIPEVDKTYTDEITGTKETIRFLGVGAGYREVGIAEIHFRTSAVLGAAHFGVGKATLTGPQSESSICAVYKTGDGDLFTVSNLTPGTYTATLTAHDGTVVTRFKFTVLANGAV